MGRDHLISQRRIDAEYWSNVDTQDEFWRQTFVDFVRPLKKSIPRSDLCGRARSRSLYCRSSYHAAFLCG
jgi:hypothetical protein